MSEKALSQVYWVMAQTAIEYKQRKGEIKNINYLLELNCLV